MRIFSLFLFIAGATTALAQNVIVTGAAAGNDPMVDVTFDFDIATGSFRPGPQFLAYASSYRGGVRVAVGDVNGDGAAEIVTSTKEGPSHIKVFSTMGVELMSFLAYDGSFAGGVNVATGDVNGDGVADIITGAGAGGGPHVKVFNGTDSSLLRSFFAYDPAFSGGVNVGGGSGSGKVVTGGGPHVKSFDGITMNEELSFFPYTPSFSGGVRVATGDVNGDGIADIVTVPMSGAASHVKVFDGFSSSELSSFFAFNPASTGGAQIAVGDLNGDGVAEMMVGDGGEDALGGYGIFDLSGRFVSGFQSPTAGSLAVYSNPVPEPATMLALGLGAAAMLRRRKRTLKS
ncbi:MAG TPA: PEP-CTERM sorting domain-containing protein [Fimbriimonas sp.]|nr:PEP-CTERM sorting domain-containing protein [Fimbriimonas sp.]